MPVEDYEPWLNSMLALVEERRKEAKVVVEVLDRLLMVLCRAIGL